MTKEQAHEIIERAAQILPKINHPPHLRRYLEDLHGKKVTDEIVTALRS